MTDHGTTIYVPPGHAAYIYPDTGPTALADEMGKVVARAMQKWPATPTPWFIGQAVAAHLDEHAID
jgi:hypothetical protein